MTCLPTAANADELYQPPVLESVDGTLDVTLTVEMTESLDGTRRSPLYNGQPMGPTIKVKPGDVLTLTLENQLDPSSADDQAKMAMVKDASADEAEVTKTWNRLQDDGALYGTHWGQHYMNIHLHGLQVDPNEVDSRVSIDGGETKTYTISIPTDHPAGLGWYHNHNHGTASYSMLSGLYGFIEVIDPATSALSEPEVAAATPKYLMLGESRVDSDTKVPVDYIGIVFDFGWTAITNGQTTPTMTVNTNEVVLFRVASASVEPDYTLAIEGVQIMPLAVDGHPITGATSLQDTVTVIPGGRLEFMAKFSTAGTYTMTRAAWNIGITGNDMCLAFFEADVATCISYDREVDVLTIVVEVEEVPVESTLPASVGAGAGAFLDDLAAMPATSERNLMMQMTPGGFQLSVPETLPPGFTQLGINNRISHPLFEDPTAFVQGTCETWTIGATGPPVPHPFHLHGMPFLVTHENGQPLSTPVWRDTHHTPVIFGDQGPEPSSFTAHVCFTRWNAYIMAHCHMPSHEDVGMSTVIPMVSPQESEPEPESEPEKASSATSAPINVVGYLFGLAVAMSA